VSVFVDIILIKDGPNKFMATLNRPWLEDFIKMKSELAGYFTVQAIVHEPADLSHVPEPRFTNKLLLEQEVRSDFTIITKDNAEVKCHKLFLTGLCPSLTKLIEVEQKDVIRLEATENIVRALLSFVYYGDLAKPMKSPGIACDLLKLGDDLNIESLEKTMVSILQEKDEEWYDAASVFQLYLATQRTEKYFQLKKKAVKLLKS